LLHAGNGAHNTSYLINLRWAGLQLFDTAGTRMAMCCNSYDFLILKLTRLKKTHAVLSTAII